MGKQTPKGAPASPLGSKAPKRDEFGRLLPGHTANPSGKSKERAELEAQVRNDLAPDVQANPKPADD